MTHTAVHNLATNQRVMIARLINSGTAQRDPHLTIRADLEQRPPLTVTVTESAAQF